MSDSTATAIASGAGPLIAALIGAYQLLLTPNIEEQRDLPFDVDRLKALEKRIRGSGATSCCSSSSWRL